MKKLTTFFLILIMSVSLLGCESKDSNSKILNTIKGNIKPYYEMTDHTFVCNGQSYKYRLEISGTMPNATKESTFIYLSNIETITFEEAWKASGLSSSDEDYFPVKDALLVEMK